MNPTARFLEVVAALQHAGCEALVMGGHAVRHYGVDRNTLDFDFHVSIQTAGQLETRLLWSGLFAEEVVEDPSWRRDDLLLIGNTDTDSKLVFWRSHVLSAPRVRENWFLASPSIRGGYHWVGGEVNE